MGGIKRKMDAVEEDPEVAIEVKKPAQTLSSTSPGIITETLSVSGSSVVGIIKDTLNVPSTPVVDTVTAMINVPGTKCGLIIGRNGETIKNLQETLGVKMLLIQENQSVSQGPKPLRITGTFDKVENAKRAIQNIINSEDSNVRQNNYVPSMGEVIVPRASVGIIIGKNGDTIKRLINDSGCKIQFKPDEDLNAPGRCATLQGTPDQIARATQMISDLLIRSQNTGQQETFLMHVPANKTGLVIGKGGDTIKQICAESGAHVELSRDPQPNESEKVFKIKGAPNQISLAQHLIRIKVGEVPPGTPFSYHGSTTSAAPSYPQNYNGYNQWQHTPTSQPNYSAQWAEYYRLIGMPEKAALIEKQSREIGGLAPAHTSSSYGSGSHY